MSDLPTRNSEPIILLEKVNKWFGDLHVLQNVDLSVGKKERIVVCGPSGSGKSTMIRCINRLEEHQEGKIVVDGIELTGNLKNIDDFLDSDNDEILRLLGIVGAYGDMIELDEKWAYYIIKQVGNYSEVFNKNLGPETRLNLNRGLNSLYLDGGLLYAPPFR